MIKEATIMEYLFTQQRRKKLTREALELKAREDQLEAEMITALEGKQRVEVGAFKLSIKKFIQAFRPSYKDCAVELASEVKVLEWVKAHDPKKEAKELVVEVRKQSKAAA